MSEFNHLSNVVNTCDVNRYNYSEAAALQALLQATHAATVDLNERIEQHDDFSGQFTINIGGQSVAFFLGGPQIEALYAFIKHIAGENFHAVDFENLTVDGSL